MSQEMYLYSVNPRKVITGLSNNDFIRSPKSVLLSKEDVLKCLEVATVYRRFPLANVDEKVTIENLDRVHRDEYISEEDWPAFKSGEASKDHGKVKVDSKQEKAADKEVELTTVAEEAKEESVEVAEPVVEEVAEKEEAVSVEAEDETTVVESDDEEW